MFYLLCLTLCLAVLFLVLAITSLLSIPAARLLERRLKNASARSMADLVLVLHLLPFSLAAAMSIGLALPAFMKFEPPSTKEMVSVPLVALAALGCGVLLVMISRTLRIWRATRIVQREWQKHSYPVSGVAGGVPLYRVDSKISLLAVTGVFKPTIFISRAVAEALTPEELSAALSHEIAHVRSHDNLKHVLMKVMAPPSCFQGRTSARESWINASEIAADEGALAQGASALELSSALIKVGRLSLANTVPGSVAASHLVARGCSSATVTRAAHLRDLLQNGTVVADVQSSGSFKTITALMLIVAAYIGCLATLLPAVHEALEFLVR
jgi:beta-lactamase regulating signal transducer with metallopeptidase domain